MIKITQIRILVIHVLINMILFKIMILLVISTFTFKHLRGYEKGSLQRRTDALPTESVEARLDMAASMGYKVTSTRRESNYLARETRNHLRRRFVGRNNAKYQTHPRETYVFASINDYRGYSCTWSGERFRLCRRRVWSSDHRRRRRTVRPHQLSSSWQSAASSNVVSAIPGSRVLRRLKQKQQCHSSFYFPFLRILKAISYLKFDVSYSMSLRYFVNVISRMCNYVYIFDFLG